MYNVHYILYKTYEKQFPNRLLFEYASLEDKNYNKLIKI